jgi:hypothetical protein
LASGLQYRDIAIVELLIVVIFRTAQKIAALKDGPTPFFELAAE